jgi:hypothetical protein
MTGYIEDKTQEQRILDLLRERGKEGAFIWDFVMPRPRGGLGIAQYSARIWGLRQKGYNIKNVEKGHFVLVEGDPKQEELL